MKVMSFREQSERILAKIDPFKKHASEYDAWFENNRFVYESELRAIKGLLPKNGQGIEVGVGSGRFAAPLGIRFGVDPSSKMREAAFEQAFRVLKPGGHLILGGIDKESPVGILYEQHKSESLFYKVATFYSVDEVKSYLKKTGFINLEFAQTISHRLSEITNLESIKQRYGEGSFVVMKASKP